MDKNESLLHEQRMLTCKNKVNPWSKCTDEKIHVNNNEFCCENAIKTRVVFIHSCIHGFSRTEKRT